MDADCSVGSCSVPDGSAFGDAGSHTGVGGSGQDYGGTLCLEIGCQVLGDIEVKLGFHVSAGCFRTAGVARLPLSPVVDHLIDIGGIRCVAPVVPRVDDDGSSAEHLLR